MTEEELDQLYARLIVERTECEGKDCVMWGDLECLLAEIRTMIQNGDQWY